IALALERAAPRRGKPARIHLCVDTGLRRVGVADGPASDVIGALAGARGGPPGRALELVGELARARGVAIDGLMMTFTEDEAFDREQLARFRTLIARVDRAGIAPGITHAASSYTLFQHPDAFLDAVRPGMALYGIYPEAAFLTTGVLDLVPAVALQKRVAYVEQLHAGESAGYNRAYVAQRPVWLATLPVGHADGLPRVAASGGRVRIGGALYPIIASIS